MRKKAVDQFTEEGEYIKTWPSVKLAAISLGILQCNLSRSMDNSGRTEGGFMWKTSINQIGEPNRFKLNCEYTEADRVRFTQKIKEYRNVLYKQSYRYDFINDSNRDDYMQEALALAWCQFYSYTPTLDDGARFGAWLKITCSWAILRYYQYNKKCRCTEFDSTLHDDEDGGG